MDQLNQPVDMQAEIKAYEEQQALDRGEMPEEDPEAALEAEPPEQPPSADPGPAHPDDDAIDEPQGKKHQGNAWTTMRAKVKAAQDEANKLREEMARREGEQRAWQAYHAQQQQLQNQQPEQVIDPTVNPIEAMQHLQQQTQEMRNYIQQQELIGQVQRAYRADAEQFLTQKPDYMEAYNHAVRARVLQLEVSGLAREQAMAQVHQEEMALAHDALKQGRSPAATMWEYATKVYGYQPKGQVTPPRNAQGQFTSPVEQEQRKAAAATSLSGQGRQPAVRTSLNIEQGAQTNGSEFDKFYEELKAQSVKAEGKRKIEWR